MTWQVEWSKAATLDIRKIESKAAKRIILAISHFAETEYGDIKKLQATEPPEWRLRIGNWRVIFRRDTSRKCLQILRIQNRRDSYR